jgi:hypothetical protein
VPGGSVVCRKESIVAEQSAEIVDIRTLGLKGLGLNHSHFYPRVAPWAVILRRPSTSLRAGFRGCLRVRIPLFESRSDRDTGAEALDQKNGLSQR